MSSLYQKLHARETLPAVEAPGEAGKGVRRDLKSELQRRLARELGGSSERLQKEDASLLRERIEALLSEEEDLTPIEREVVAEDLLATIIGLGPLQSLIDDASITEIMVNGPHDVFIERGGRLQRANVRFRDDKEVMDLIDRIVAPLGRRIDEQSPMVDARLKDGSRVNAVIPPLALNGPCVTIRRFPARPLSMNDLIKNGTISSDMAEFCRAAVRARLNIVISGGTASGKTTFLNSLSSFIPEDERIVTIEDAAELRLQQDHVVSMEMRPPNLEGTGEVTIRDLVRNSLRMRPDRIVVGEVRSGEALDMLQAMNTGHDGSLTTVHANGPREALSRIETMVLMAGIDLPLRAIREQIASAVNIVIQVARSKDGSRRVTHIAEVHGLEGDVVVLQDLFSYDEASGAYQSSGFRPRAYERFRNAGVDYALPGGVGIG